MKLKKILALAGVAILALLYIITLISALLTSPAAPHLFKACILATFVVPVFLYGYLLIYRLMKERADAAKKDIDEKIKKGAESEESPDSDISQQSVKGRNSEKNQDSEITPDSN